MSANRKPRYERLDRNPYLLRIYKHHKSPLEKLMYTHPPANDPYENLKDQIMIQQQEDNNDMFKRVIGLSSLIVGAVTGAVITAFASRDSR